MPAITAPDILVLPRVATPDAVAAERPVRRVITARKFLEGAGFEVRRPFPGIDLSLADPFLLLDHLGAVEYAPGEAKGAPWHPHRGFETVTYIMDGALRHTDSNGGGGLITDGGTQWMTAGAGILHDEMPTEELVQKGGLFHGVQLWVNLPRELKWAPPRYQDITSGSVRLLSTGDGGALVRLIAGSLPGADGPLDGPGSTYTPITYAHVTLSPGGQMRLPWRADFNALVYVLAGSGTVGTERRSVAEGQLAVFGPGDAMTVRADAAQDSRNPNLDVLVLGGRPLREPVARYGPFVMNTREEIITAIEDFQAGRMGTIPAAHLGGQTEITQESPQESTQE